MGEHICLVMIKDSMLNRNLTCTANLASSCSLSLSSSFCKFSFYKADTQKQSGKEYWLGKKKKRRMRPRVTSHLPVPVSVAEWSLLLDWISSPSAPHYISPATPAPAEQKHTPCKQALLKWSSQSLVWTEDLWLLYMLTLHLTWADSC